MVNSMYAPTSYNSISSLPFKDTECKSHAALENAHNEKKENNRYFWNLISHNSSQALKTYTSNGRKNIEGEIRRNNNRRKIYE